MRGQGTLVVVAAMAAAGLSGPAAAYAGGAPSIGWSPTTSSPPPAYDYGSVDPAQPTSQTFTLTNSGGSATGMVTISLSGSTTFTKTADTCTGTALGPRKSCTVTVQYAPTTGGQTDTATLTARGKRSAASASITLTGQGGTADLTLTPGTLTGTSNGTNNYNYDFGDVLLGSQTFTVTNSGTAASNTLQLQGGDGAGFSLSNDTCSGSALAPGATCTLDLNTTTCGRASTTLLVLQQDNGDPYIDLTATLECT
jgi:hypothetical protein